jgi:hypothetical protein
MAELDWSILVFLDFGNRLSVEGGFLKLRLLIAAVVPRGARLPERALKRFLVLLSTAMHLLVLQVVHHVRRVAQVVHVYFAFPHRQKELLERLAWINEGPFRAIGIGVAGSPPGTALAAPSSLV